jgi:hypothetical protein
MSRQQQQEIDSLREELNSVRSELQQANKPKVFREVEGPLGLKYIIEQGGGNFSIWDFLDVLLRFIAIICFIGGSFYIFTHWII